MKKMYSGMEAAEMLENVEAKWTETEEYNEWNRGVNGEYGKTRVYVKIADITYELGYGREGFPVLTEK